MCTQELADQSHLGGAGHAIEKSNAIEQEAGGKRAQKEILQPRLIRPRLATEKARQHVKRDGENLQAEENGHQVGTRRHPHGTGGGKQDQRVVFADRVILALEVFVGHQDGEPGGKQKDQTEESGEIIQPDAVAKADLRGAVRGPAGQSETRGNHQGDDADPGDVGCFSPR